MYLRAQRPRNDEQQPRRVWVDTRDRSAVHRFGPFAATTAPPSYTLFCSRTIQPTFREERTPRTARMRYTTTCIHKTMHEGRVPGYGLSVRCLNRLCLGGCPSSYEFLLDAVTVTISLIRGALSCLGQAPGATTPRCVLVQHLLLRVSVDRV